MKTKIIIIFLMAISVLCVCSCIKAKHNVIKIDGLNSKHNWNTSGNINISIFLDLSDRLVKTSNSMTQKDKDIDLIDYFTNCFINKALKEKIQGNKDRMQVFFYPTPEIPQINQLANDLTIDMNANTKEEQKNKRRELIDFKPRWMKCLNNIYTSTLKSKNWIGSDIWGFFDNQVDVQCIKKDYRNILVILTDGYIYDKNNMIDKGDETSYLLEKTLSNPKAKLIATRTDLKDLEVLVLEVNPSHPQDFTHMKNIMEDWFKRMGVKHYRIAQTDIPINTEKVISKFIEEK